MRTKTLLIAAATLAVGVATSMAQTTYSQNIVGYVNGTLQSGYSLLCAPVSPNGTNDAQTLLPALTSGDVLLLWNGSGYTVDLYNGPNDWYDGQSFNPITEPNLPGGQAFFYQNNSGVNETNTFTGNCVLSNSVALPNGYALVASTAPIAASIESTNYNIPFTSGDVVLFWNGGGYTVDLYNGPNDWYDGQSFNPIVQPTLGVGQGFFYQNNSGAPHTWTQNFIVQ